MRELGRLKIGNRKDDRMPVYLKQRNIHCFVIGGSGSGKSTTLTNCFEQDRGVCRILLEPHGFQAKECYALTKGNADYVSVDNRELGFNPMLYPYDINTKSEIIAEALNEMIVATTPNEKLYSKMRDLLDQAVKYCHDAERFTLLAVRDRIINGPGRAETKDGLVSRLNFILNDDRMRDLLCAKKTIHIGNNIERQRPLLINGERMGPEKLVFIGHIVSQDIKSYFLYERPAVYKPCSVYIDECQLFVNQSFMTILREARKFNLSLTLATQSFAGMPDAMVRTLCNVGNLICYRVGYREAALLAKEMDMEARDIQFLEKYHAYYLTPEEKGLAKMSRPLYVKPMEVKKAVPKVKSKGWFTLGSCPTEAHP